MTQKFVLTKLELVRAASYLQLNNNYDCVMFIQKNTSGIGTTTWARFYRAGTPDKYQEIDVTDVSTW